VDGASACAGCCGDGVLLVWDRAGAVVAEVRLFATGGTISGYSANRDDQFGYRSGTIPPDKLLADIPEAKKVADLSYDEIAEVGSPDQYPDPVEAGEGRECVAGTAGFSWPVVSHGTATMEETTYFLNLVIHSKKPVVVVGAMRPFTSISRDGRLTCTTRFGWRLIRTQRDGV